MMEDDDFCEELAVVQAALDEKRWESEEEESNYQELSGLPMGLFKQNHRFRTVGLI